MQRSYLPTTLGIFTLAAAGVGVFASDDLRAIPEPLVRRQLYVSNAPSYLRSQNSRDLAALEQGFETIGTLLDHESVSSFVSAKQGVPWTVTLSFDAVPAGPNYELTASIDCVTNPVSSVSCGQWDFTLYDSGAHRVNRKISGTVDPNKQSAMIKDRASLDFPVGGNPIYLTSRISPFFDGDLASPILPARRVTFSSDLSSSLYDLENQILSEQEQLRNP